MRSIGNRQWTIAHLCHLLIDYCRLPITHCLPHLAFQGLANRYSAIVPGKAMRRIEFYIAIHRLRLRDHRSCGYDRRLWHGGRFTDRCAAKRSTYRNIASVTGQTMGRIEGYRTGIGTVLYRRQNRRAGRRWLRNGCRCSGGRKRRRQRGIIFFKARIIAGHQGRGKQGKNKYFMH